MSNRIELLPDPSRMIEGLRDTGYRFNTAVADIVDNSIAADASVVSIDLKADYGGDLVLFVADNGTGMDRQGLITHEVWFEASAVSCQSGQIRLGPKTAQRHSVEALGDLARFCGFATSMASWDLDRELITAGSWNLFAVRGTAASSRTALAIVAEPLSGGSE